jgi:hypothetical protein
VRVCARLSVSPGVPVARSVSIFPRTTVRARSAREDDMATEQEKKPQETREADTERKDERKQTTPKESHEGMPGYGQAPDDVREKKLPDQKW